MNYKDGDRIWLKANEEEGWEREEAIVIGVEDDGVIMVEVVIRPEGDLDGLREITEDQIEV